VIAISRQVRDHLVRDFKLDEKKITVIHNGIDVDRFQRQMTDDGRQIRASLGLGDGPVIGIIARLSDVKGHKYLIQAMSEVLKKYPAANLLIVGEGKTRKELTARVESLGINKNVFFVSETQDTAKTLSAMDIFVMPSLQEGLGLALMEAMAEGLAVIGSNIGGIKTLIQDGHNGLLVEPADSSSIAQAILTLLGNPSKRLELGKEAQGYIQNNFSQEKMVLETEKEYLNCLNIKD
jgi:glycosyltransferase involved in cell wall biosynthesis